MNPIRVAQIMGKLNAGGVESVVYNYYRHIDHNKIQFDFYVDDDSTLSVPKDILEMGARVFVIPRYQNVFQYMKALRKHFEEEKYQIVHSNMNTLSVFSLRAAKKAGVPVRICHSHSTAGKGEFCRNLLKRILKPFSKKYATHLFACSELAGRWLFGNKAYDDGKVTVINNAIDLERFRFNKDVRDQMRAQYGIGDRFCIGHVGRFTEQKNQGFLLEIFYEFLKRRPESVLLLVGDGPLHDELTKKVEELSLTDKVIFAGVHKHSERYYQAMDCFLLPSLYEGLPVVGIEAQAAGLHVITSQAVTRDLNIVDRVEFLSFENSPIDWADHIMQLNIPADRNASYLKMKGTIFDLQNEAGKLEKIYEEICR